MVYKSMDFEQLDSILRGDEAIVTLKPDGSYSIKLKRKLITNDGSDAGWLYYDIPNARLDDKGRYIAEPSKEDEIGNRVERRHRNNGKSNEKRRNKTTTN